MSLHEIYCQDKAVSILQRMLAGSRLAQSYIFAGPQGVGKFKLAKEWGKLLLCEKPKSAKNFQDSCGVCESCRLVEAGTHPDFNHIYKELSQYTENGKDKTTPIDLPIDVIREFLIQKVSQKPAMSHRKVFVVSEAEKLNASSQNSLLKVLEEPPTYCCIILLCTHLERLLPTTKSRCQIIHFGPIDEEKISQKLAQMGIAPKQADYFAKLANGSIGNACKWAQLELAGAGLYETKKKIIHSFADYKYSDALELAEQILAYSKNISEVWEKQDESLSQKDITRRTHKLMIQMVISALQDAMKLKVDADSKIINFDQKGEIEAIGSRDDIEKLAGKIAIAYKAVFKIDASVNERLIFEQLLLNLSDFDTISV